MGGGARQAGCAVEEASEGNADLGDTLSLYPPPHRSPLLCYLIHPHSMYGRLVRKIRSTNVLRSLKRPQTADFAFDHGLSAPHSVNMEILHQIK